MKGQLCQAPEESPWESQESDPLTSKTLTKQLCSFKDELEPSGNVQHPANDEPYKPYHLI